MTEGYLRTLPRLDVANRSFWTSGSDGKLRILQCNSCKTWIHPPSPICPVCLGSEIEPQVVSGLATVEAYTINCRSWAPGMEVPYVIAIVNLDEQKDLRLTTNIVGIEPEKVKMGLRVQVTFEHDDDVWIPQFTPVKDDH